MRIKRTKRNKQRKQDALTQALSIYSLMRIQLMHRWYMRLVALLNKNSIHEQIEERNTT